MILFVIDESPSERSSTRVVLAIRGRYDSTAAHLVSSLALPVSGTYVLPDTTLHLNIPSGTWVIPQTEVDPAPREKKPWPERLDPAPPAPARLTSRQVDRKPSRRCQPLPWSI